MADGIKVSYDGATHELNLYDEKGGDEYYIFPAVATLGYKDYPRESWMFRAGQKGEFTIDPPISRRGGGVPPCDDLSSFPPYGDDSVVNLHGGLFFPGLPKLIERYISMASKITVTPQAQAVLRISQAVLGTR